MVIKKMFTFFLQNVLIETSFQCHYNDDKSASLEGGRLSSHSSSIDLASEDLTESTSYQMESLATGEREALENEENTLLPPETFHNGREAAATEFPSFEACVASGRSDSRLPQESRPANEYHADTMGHTAAMNVQTYVNSCVDRDVQESRPANEYYTDTVGGASVTHIQTYTNSCIDREEHMNPALHYSQCQTPEATDNQGPNQEDDKTEPGGVAPSLAMHKLHSTPTTLPYSEGGVEPATVAGMETHTPAPYQWISATESGSSETQASSTYPPVFC